MKETIKELGSLCKKAAELERKWDKAGGEFLGARMQNVDYMETVKEYLESVSRLEVALRNHLAAVTDEIEHPRDALKRGGDETNQGKPAS